MTKPRTAQQTGPERIYHKIKGLILDNTLPAGSMILQEELSRRLGVSRTPVREAIIRLETDGLIEIIPRRGIRIATISLDDMREIYELLTALEAEAAQLAAQRGISNNKLNAMRATLDMMDAALDVDDLVAWAEADNAFHQHLVEAAQNKRLSAIVALMADQAHRVRRLTLAIRDRPVRSNEDHRALVDALACGNAEQARTVHYRHRRTSGDMLISLLKRHNLCA